MTERQTRFLFIDDDELVLSALRRVVRSLPFEFHFTTEPETAFQVVAEKGIDVVISDHSMPHMSGAEFFSVLRRLHGSVRRVMMTGQSDRSITLAAINEGQVERFIEKPWSNEQLAQVIAELDSEVRASRRGAKAAKAPSLGRTHFPPGLHAGGDHDRL